MPPAPPQLCILGSINMDLVVRAPHLPAPGETLLGGPFATLPGGKGANQAVAAARTGSLIRMIGAVGDDAHGQQMRETLAADAVDCSAISTRPGTPTGIAIITVGEDSENTIVVAPGANATLGEPDVLAARAAITSADLLLMQLEVPLHTVTRAALLAKESGVTVVLNAAPACKLPWDLLAALDVLVVNQSEAATVLAAATMGADAAEIALWSPERQLEGLDRLGIPCIIMTLGAEGAAISHRRSVRRISSFPITPIDTVGAGDAFCGTFATRWAEHQISGALDPDAIADAATWACAAGALATTRAGAIPSLPARAEVVKLLCGK